MYFPYLRGRQNELLCLRELLEQDLLSTKIIPVIEPVRCSSTLFSTLSKFVENGRDIIVIKNPKVGHFEKEGKELCEKIQMGKESDKKDKDEKKLEVYRKIWEDEHIVPAYICDDEIITKCKNKEIPISNVVLINKNLEYFEEYEEDYEKLSAKYTLVPDNRAFMKRIEGGKVVLEDSYIKEKRNIDYITKPDTFFSRNHLDFKEDRLVGFSDYSIVGNEYEESGFAPLAVAIHILYFTKRNEIRIHHFVSDSNENISDPARKFAEAMENLIDWENFTEIPKTYGLRRLLEYYDTGKFPGLGIVKKYSIMHHMEMIGTFLEEN